MVITLRTLYKAIHNNCLDCVCGSAHNIKICDVEKCALHKHRNGPQRKGKKNA